MPEQVTQAELKEQLSHVEYQLALINAHERDESKMLESRRAKIKDLEAEITKIHQDSLTAPERRARLLNIRHSVITQLANLTASKVKPPSHKKLADQLFETVLNRVLANGKPSPRELAFLTQCKSTTQWSKLWDEYKDLEQA